MMAEKVANDGGRISGLMAERAANDDGNQV